MRCFPSAHLRVSNDCVRLDPLHAVPGRGVKDLLEGISEDKLRVNPAERINIDEEPDLKSWREAIEDVADAAQVDQSPRDDEQR